MTSMPKRKHYVYYSYEDWGRGYIGKRACPVGIKPEDDIKYFGSYTDPTFKPTNKEILIVVDTDTEASKYEYLLQKAYSVVDNPDFANQCYQHSNKFTSYGRVTKQSTRNKISMKNKGRNKGKVMGPRSQTTKNKISETKKRKAVIPWNKNKSGLQTAWNKNKSCPQISAAVQKSKPRFVFKNVVTNEIVRKTTGEMEKEYEGVRQGYWKLTKRKLKEYKNWILI